MFDDIQIRKCTKLSRNIIKNLMQFYFYDLLQYSQYAHYKLQKNGFFEKLPYFENYWNEDNRHTFLIKKGALPIGFALVHDITLNNDADWKMAEFFILATHRKQGIAKYAINFILNQLPGIWEISVLKDNKIAKNFWANVLMNPPEKIYNQYPEFIVYETKVSG